MVQNNSRNESLKKKNQRKKQKNWKTIAMTAIHPNKMYADPLGWFEMAELTGWGSRPKGQSSIVHFPDHILLYDFHLN